MQRLTVMLCFAFVVVMNVCVAQLNFSTGWPKRSTEPSCKTSVESLMVIYKLIQVREVGVLCVVVLLTGFCLVLEWSAEACRLCKAIQLSLICKRFWGKRNRNKNFQKSYVLYSFLVYKISLYILNTTTFFTFFIEKSVKGSIILQIHHGAFTIITY